jgi:hypothetical protein
MTRFRRAVDCPYLDDETGEWNVTGDEPVIVGPSVYERRRFADVRVVLQLAAHELG